MRDQPRKYLSNPYVG